MSSQATLPGIPTATSSPASAVGPTHSDLPESKDGESGPGAVHASPSPLPGRAREPTTSGTCGRSSTGSSASASLQRSLASRLQARLDGLGSPLYSLTWKTWDMPLREPICALRASGRRTFDNGFGGWPTPLADSSETRTPESSERRAAAGRPLTLSGAASLAGWPTPDTMQGPHGARGVSTNPNHQSGRDLQAVAGWATPRVANNGGIGSPERAADGKARLEDQVQGAGWVTPSARDWKDTPGMATEGVNPDGTKRNRVDQLPRQAAMVCGQEPTTSNVSTGKRGQLSPAFSLWLMGFPVAWALCAEAATPSSRKSRKSL